LRLLNKDVQFAGKAKKDQAVTLTDCDGLYLLF
jgi:hypothetical protein